MNERPGNVHPRRPPAHASVSLRHSPPASDKANPPSSLSPRLHTQHTSSGESSDAAGWFESTNNGRAHDASFVDNDPPFRPSASSSSDRTPPDVPDARHASDVPALPYRPTLLALGTDGGSSTEDFRSVIDDLTVANKRLKHRLRRYERIYDAHLQHEKLFEVRFHALPDHKKRELEETLRRFAASLDDPDRPDVALPTLTKDPTASSTSRFAESGYVSMSASGQNSSTPSNGPSNPPVDSRRMTKSAYHRQQQTIHSYLHDIPAGLLPQHNDVPLSDKARKKLVVRRLEQIFAGKRSAPGTHPQPMQQEEVAQSAATADRREREATGRGARPEGQRTALIMPEDAWNPPPLHHIFSVAAAANNTTTATTSTSGSGSPDQRPTRPLDLDPYRAQIPAANMQYFRHLGFSPPDMTTSTESHDGHGWLYLNLLINLAQLHTLNVTPENVKDAIAEYSTQLELSPDGRKIRWKGGHDFTKDSSDGSPDQLLQSPYPAMAHRSPQKSSNPGHSASVSGGSDRRKLEPHSKFAYKPLFFRRDSSEEDQDLYQQTESSGSPLPQPRADSSGLGSNTMRSNPSAKRRDDGPMIFYNKARFCTDLTGDRVGASLTLPENYKTITSHPLGAGPDPAADADAWEPRGPLADSTPDDRMGAQTPSSLSSLGFSPADLQRYISAGSDAMDFEASGLGGVHPDDNFSIRVQRAQVPQAPATHRPRASLYPPKIQAILNHAPRRSASPKPTIKESMLSAVHRPMPSSTLPPPSFYPSDSHSSGSLSDDEDSSANDSNNSNTGGPSTTLQLLNVAPPVPLTSTSALTSEASEYSSDSDSNLSIDLLATARQQDPDTVRAFEREYDAAVADRLAEEIVAGSSAATAGGGSGFNSPASPAGLRLGSRRGARNRSDHSQSEDSLSPRARNLKRARTESLAAAAAAAAAVKGKSRRVE